jgi:hypothetical protein
MDTLGQWFTASIVTFMFVGLLAYMAALAYP